MKLTKLQTTWLNSVCSNWYLSEKGIITNKSITILGEQVYHMFGSYDIPVKFYNVHTFIYTHSKLTTLKNGPIIANDYHVHCNHLKNLIGGPKIVNTFNCSYNELTSLKGAPNNCKDFMCQHNSLENLQYGPVFAQYYDCSHNKLTSLKGAPHYSNDFSCSSNLLKNLIDSPTCNSITIDSNIDLFGICKSCDIYAEIEKLDMLIKTATEFSGHRFINYDQLFKYLIKNNKLDIIRNFKNSPIRNIITENILRDIDNGIYTD